MPARTFDVEWEVAADDRLGQIVQPGITTAAPEHGHSVHVELTGLRPGADFFYRFRVDGHISPVGPHAHGPRTRSLAPLTMCFGSCSNFEHGWFTAYRSSPKNTRILLCTLAITNTSTLPGSNGQSGNVCVHVGPETVTLANYRQRYAQYKTDPDLQAAHAAAPWWRCSTTMS